MDQGYSYGWEAGYARNRSATADDDDDEHSDDGPLLAYKYDKYRHYAPYTTDGKPTERRRSPLGVVVRFTLFCTAMILFCVLMYIPMYNRVIHHVPKDIVAGWPVHTNRDTKIYVQPNNITTLHEPKHICSKSENKRNKLFLLIVVCSSTTNFDRRIAIRETWGSYKNYLELTKLYAMTKERYKNYNYTYDLYPEPTIISINSTEELNRTRREAGFAALLPKLAEALKNMQKNDKTDTATEEKRFEDENDNNLQEFDMNKEIENINQDTQEVQQDYDYDYPSNVMKIPLNGYADTPDIDKVLNMLKKQKLNLQQELPKKEDIKLPDDIELDFKLTFLLGLPPQDNSTDVQSKIEEEVERYGDVIQENFVDSYNNLTLKSIMMLKWVTNHCSDSLRYILKTDDDMYINVPSLMSTLRNKSLEHERREGRAGDEYVLMGDLIHGAKPVLDASNKWFSPRYMYGGRVYPRYLSGTGYALSLPAARALYRAALDTPYFHLEDVYITGICALRSVPRVRPQWSFSQHQSRSPQPCDAYSHVKVHRVPPAAMRSLHVGLQHPHTVDRCERIRLTQVRRDRLRPKTQPKPLTKLVRPMT